MNAADNLNWLVGRFVRFILRVGPVAANHGDPPGADQLDDPEGPHHFDEGLDLQLGVLGHVLELDAHARGGAVDADGLELLVPERLPLVHVFLPMALDPVPEDLVEEHAAGPIHENGRAGVGLHQRGLGHTRGADRSRGQDPEC